MRNTTSTEEEKTQFTKSSSELRRMDNHRPLLQNPKTSPRKTLRLILSIAAIISSSALVATHLLKPIFSDPFLVQRRHICDQAHNLASCLAMVSEVVGDTNTIVQMNHVHLLQVLLKRSADEIQKVMEKAQDVKHRINDDRKEQLALVDCVQLMELSRDRIFNSIAALENRSSRSCEDAHAWLSSVLTNHVTCWDGLEGITTRTSMEAEIQDLISRARNFLAMLLAVSPLKKTSEVTHESLKGGFPSWVTNRDRRLLQALPKEIKADVVVAKDGSGKYKTLGEALASAPDKSKIRYVIHVKKGTYKENVEVGKKKQNVMIVGDCMNSTIITGSLNVIDGSTTFKSATVAAVGDGFIAQDIWFKNTAGPQKHQAVALRVGADQSIINRCRIDAYQDTLYAHSNRQFYRDSYITGTVDFIFGNAAVVFQNCKIVARKPMSGQSNMVTAQSRTDPNQATGTSIQNCDIIASTDLEPVKGSVRSYLGRPWKEYSRTVVMQSYIGDHIDPAGWSVWSEDFALKTLYYGEYDNKGPGAGTSKRVNWPGYRLITSKEEAKKFTVAELIQGGTWLKSSGVAYSEGL